MGNEYIFPAITGLNSENQRLLQMMVYNMGNYSPYFTGKPAVSMGNAASPSLLPSSTTTNSQMSIIEQAKIVDKKIKEVKDAKTKINGKVEVKVGNDTYALAQEQYDEQTGYIAEDGRNDGKIGFWKTLKNLAKGSMNLVTDLFCDEKGNISIGKTLKNVALGAGLAALTIIPGVGSILAGTALATGAFTLAKGIAGVAAAKTDEADEKAWQDVGSGTLQTALSLFGIKNMGKTTAAKLGTEIPKWYRPDKAVINSCKAAKIDVNTAGGWTKYVANKFGNIKIGIDKIITKASMKSYSYYQNKYNTNLKTIEHELQIATGGYKRILTKLKSAYENVYNASDEAALNAAKAELSQISQNAERYLSITRNSGSTTEQTIASMEKIVKISKSIAPDFARKVKLSTVKLTNNDLKSIISNIESQISELQQNSFRTAAEQLKLNFLKHTKIRYQQLYAAKTPEEQTKVLALLEKLNKKAIQEMNKVRTTPGTTNETMAAYNDLVSMTENNVFNADIIMNARKKDLLAAKSVIESTLSTTAERMQAEAFIKNYRPNIYTKDQYIQAVDDIITELKYKKLKPTTSAFNWGNIHNKAKSTSSVVKNTLNEIKNPDIWPAVMLSTTDSRLWGDKNIWFAEYALKAETQQYQEQIKTYDEYLKKLYDMRKDLTNGKSVDLSWFKREG